MILGRTMGLRCGHFTRRETMEFDTIFDAEKYFSFVAPFIGSDKQYCEKCNDYSRILRINVFEILRDIPEFS